MSQTMAYYVGTKITMATPMTRQAYNDYRGWQLPADENGADEGYLVEYLDGGAANHPSHAGYISWSPKNIHERAYISVGDMGHLQPHQLRVVAEKAQLDDRISKLDSFFHTETFKKLRTDEQGRLFRQRGFMVDYARLLGERIAAF